MVFKTIDGRKVNINNLTPKSSKSIEKPTGIKLSPKIQKLKIKLEDKITKDFQKDPDDPNLVLKRDIAQMKLDVEAQKEFVAKEDDPERKKELQSFVPVLEGAIKELEKDIKE